MSLGGPAQRGHIILRGRLYLRRVYEHARPPMDAELWAALSGYDVALQQAYRRRRIATPRHRSAGLLFGEMMPQTLEDIRLFCYRIAPAVDRALASWLRMGEEEVADALVRIQRLIRYVLENGPSDGEHLPGVPLVYEVLE